jgi:hypothetical protein
MIIAGLVGVTGATLGVAGGVPAATAAVTGPTLTVSPTHGTWSVPFTATYAEPAGLLGLCRGASVTFLLDGLRLGAADLTRRSGDCAATLNVRLPDDKATRARYGAPGRHTVRTGDGAAATTYTIDPDPPPVAQVPDATSAAAAASGSATPPADPSPAESTPASEPAGAVASGVDLSGSAPALASAGVGAVPPQRTSRATSGMSPLVIGTGLAIFLGSAILMVLATGSRATRRPVMGPWDAQAITAEVPVVAPPSAGPDPHPQRDRPAAKTSPPL